MKEMVLGVVGRRHQIPNFINRIDEVVVFHPLGEQHIASIAQISCSVCTNVWKNVVMKSISPTRR